MEKGRIKVEEKKNGSLIYLKSRIIKFYFDPPSKLVLMKSRKNFGDINVFSFFNIFNESNDKEFVITILTCLDTNLRVMPKSVNF